MYKANKLTMALLIGFTALGRLSFVGLHHVQASTTYQRDNITKLKKVPYYAIKNAKTYQFSGTADQLTMTVNHHLKNYKNTTWTVSKKTHVIKKGKSYAYYYVKNAKNGATGWVWHKYLARGKNYQMSSAKKVTKKYLYVRAKQAKFYQLSGNQRYVKLSRPQELNLNTYKVTRQRYIYKHGKKYSYYFITGKTGAKGWVWHKYMAPLIPLPHGKHEVPRYKNVPDAGGNGTIGTAGPNGHMMDSDW